MADGRVLFAVGDEAEGRRFETGTAPAAKGFLRSYLKTLPEVEAR